MYVEQPHGFIVAGQESKVYKLHKALYGPKQAPRAWNARLNSYLLQKGFMQCPYEHSLYVKVCGDDYLFVCIYVDDMIFYGSNISLIQSFKQAMKQAFEMTNLWYMTYFLGLEVRQSSKGIFVSQVKYVIKVLKKFSMDKCIPVESPMELGIKLTRQGKGKIVCSTYYKSLVGSLRYLTWTRSDILFTTGLVSRYMETPKTSHLLAVKRILRYI